jgi:ferrous iron transport protein A
MSLEQLPVGANARVKKLQGGFGFQQHIQNLGLKAGQVLRKVRHNGSGPILVEFDAQTVAVGRGIAHRIIVDELADDR